MVNPMETSLNYCATEASRTKGRWRALGLKNTHLDIKHIDYGRTTVYKFRVGLERGALHVGRNTFFHGQIVPLVLKLSLHPTNSPPFYQALQVLGEEVGFTFRIEPTTLVKPLVEICPSGSRRVTPPYDLIFLGDKLIGEWGDVLQRNNLSPIRYV
jgi:hypothetical protein